MFPIRPNRKVLTNKIKNIIESLTCNTCLKNKTYHQMGSSYQISNEDIFEAFRYLNKEPDVTI